MRRFVAIVVAVATIPLSGLIPARAATPPSPPPVRESGYLRMADGVHLRYTVVRPAGSGRVPVLFEYSGYSPGTNPDNGYVNQFVVRDGGYAYIGVNIRGTGCSEGTFDFFHPQEARDGAAVIEWVTRQPWSNGKVGMIGKSYPGITQLFVAEQQPKGLVAIAPGHFFADAYRDVARPGGIANIGFSSLWSFIGRPSYEFQNSPKEVIGGDSGCTRGSSAEITGLPTNPFVQLLQHPYDDELVRERSPATHLDRIRVPMLATLSWQDEQLASRGTHLLASLDELGRDNWWATLTNGDHGMARTPTELADLERFYDHFLKGERNGWEQRPRVLVWWEAGRDGQRAPAWVSALDHWSDERRPVKPWALHFRREGAMTVSPPRAGEGGDSWTAVPAAGSQGVGNPHYGAPDAGLPNVYMWGQSPPKGTAVAYTSPRFDGDRTFLGTGSVDLWLSSTAPDTDLQVTLTEVRPDGQEVYIQKGWLKASQRRLDRWRSTSLRPVQTHQQRHVAPLAAGVPVLARVELFPFGHLVRRGSRLRLWIESPTPLPELWAFAPSPYAARNTILHDDVHRSRLVLPLVPNDANRRRTLPACGTVIRQPCRTDPLRGS